MLTTSGYGATNSGVRMADPGSEAEAEDVLTGPPLTSGYKPSIPAAFFQAVRSESFLPTMLADVEGMLLHPVVITPYEYYKSAIQSVRFKVKASSSKVGSFVLAELQKFWGRALEKVQQGYDYGWVGGEISYRYDKGVLGFYSLDTFHPLDTWALTHDNSYVGVSVVNVPDAKKKTTLWGPQKYPAKAFWFAHNRRWDRYYGRSQLYGAWRPWRRLAYRDGAEEVIDGGVYRFAYRGPIMRFPARAFPGTGVGGVDYDGARNKAREFVENAKAGVGVALPNSRDASGNYEWEIDWPDHTINVSSLVEYAKYLEGQVSLGVGVPMELLQASDTGSGWSGRKVPLLGFYQTQKKNATAVVVAWKGQVGDPLVAWNFGPEAWFEVAVELMLPGGLSEDGQGAPGGGGMPPPAPGGGESPLAGLMGGVPGGGGDEGGGGEMSTLGGEDMRHTLVAAMRSGGRQQARQATYERPPGRKGRKRRRVELSSGYDLADAGQRRYVPGKSSSGRLIGVNPNDPSDKIYGRDAEEYFRRASEQARQHVDDHVASKGERMRNQAARRQEKKPEQAQERQEDSRGEARQMRERAQQLARRNKPQQAREAMRRAQELDPGEGHEERAFSRDLENEVRERQGAEGPAKPPEGGLDTDVVPTSAEGRGRAERQQARGQRASERAGEEAEAARKKEAGQKQGMLGKALSKVAAFFRNAKQARADRREANEERSWQNYEQWLRDVPENLRPLARTMTDVGSAILDYVPGALGRLKDEVRQQNRKGAGGESGEGGEDRAEGILGLIENTLDAVGDTMSTLLDSIDPTGFVGSAIGAVAGGPILSMAYLASSAVLNPLGTMQAAWNTLTMSTKGDKEKAAKRAGRHAEAERYARLPEDSPEVQGRLKKNRQLKEKGRRDAEGTSMGFDLASEGEGEGKLYPRLRHRVREVFENAEDADWAEALFFAALDLHRDDPAKAIEAVENALKKSPKRPNLHEHPFDPESWFDFDKIQLPGDGEDAGAEAESPEQGAGEAELSTLVAESLWVLRAAEDCTDEDLRGLQRRLKALTPEVLADVKRRVREGLA